MVLMKITINKKYASVAAYVCVSAVIILIFYFAGNNFGKIASAVARFNDVMSPVYYGLIFAYIANPVMVSLEKNVFKFKKERKKLKRALSLLTTYIIILSIITAFFMLLLPQIIDSYNDLYSRIGVFINEISPNVEKFFASINAGESSAASLFDIYDKFAEIFTVEDITELLKTVSQKFYSLFQTHIPNIFNFFSVVFVEFKNIFIGLIFSVYFLGAKEKLCAQIKKIIRCFLSEKSYKSFFEFLEDTDKMFGSFIVGKIVDSLIIGFITFVVLGIIGMPYYPLISVIVCITNVIPFIGPFIGAVPCAFIVLMVSPVYCAIFIVFIFVLQQIDGNYIGPKIIGDAIGLSSLWILFAITVMGGYFGLFGLLIGAPLFAVLYSLIKKYIENRLKARKLPVETSCYMAPVLINDTDSQKNSANTEGREEDGKLPDEKSDLTDSGNGSSRN